MMPSEFVDNFKMAFGKNVPLPIAFYYSDKPIATTKKIAGCIFKCFSTVRDGNSVSLNAEVIGCGGGKLYTGFAPMNDYIPGYVSHKEKYKSTPLQVINYVKGLEIQSQEGNYLNFERLDKLDSFDNIEGVLFFATPDMLSGLTTWTFFDNDSEDAVSAIFGSGCSSIISLAVKENRIGGKRTFLGLFDPSVRPYTNPNELSFVIPAIRFKEMCLTFRKCCLFDTTAWAKVKARINE